MLKLVLLLSLPLIIASFVFRAWGNKRGNGMRLLGITGKGLTLSVLNKTKKAVQVKLGSKTTFKEPYLYLSEIDSNTKQLSALSELLLFIGSTFYSEKDLSSFTKNTVRLTNITFPLIIVICVFGFIARTFPLNLCLIILLLTVAMSCFSHLYLTYFRYLAYLTAKKALNTNELKIRESELEALLNYTKKNVFTYAAPKTFDLFLPKDHT